MDFDDLTTFDVLIAIAGVAMLISIFAAIMDRMQRRRRNLDRISIVAWGLISAMMLILSIGSLAAALHAR